MKYIYNFKEGEKLDKVDIGIKGKTLSNLSSLNIRVPTGFIISTKGYIDYKKNNELSDEFRKEVNLGIKAIEKATGKRFGSLDNPLLLSVRSSSIDENLSNINILNVGLNDNIADINNMLDSYRRFIEDYSININKYSKSIFRDYLNSYKEIKNYKYDSELTDNDLRNIILKYKDKYLESGGSYFIEDVNKILFNIIKAIYDSCQDERGIAICIQMMISGNIGFESYSGVISSSNPFNGDEKIYGEYLDKIQGRDITSGLVTPKDINDIGDNLLSKLEEISKLVEKVNDKIMDIEFTVTDNKIYILECKPMLVTEEASINYALRKKDKDFIRDVNVDDIKNLKDYKFKERIIPISKARVLNPGFASSKMSIDKADVKGKIYICDYIESSDYDVVKDASGVIVKRGSSLSNLVIRFRKENKPIVCLDNIEIDKHSKSVKIRNRYIPLDNGISIDKKGYIYERMLKMKEIPNDLVQKVDKRVDKYSKIKIIDDLIKCDDLIDSPIKKKYIQNILNDTDKRESCKELERLLASDLKELLKDKKEVYIKYFDINLDEFGISHVRTLITYPELVISISEALAETFKGSKLNIIIPSICDVREIEYIKLVLDKLLGKKIKYKLGVIISNIRSIIESKYISEKVDFFVYDLNDITKLTYSLGEDKTDSFINGYYKKKIFKNNPYETIDKIGVGSLLKLSIKSITKKKMDLIVYGNFTKDENSFKYLKSLGINHIIDDEVTIPKLLDAKANIDE